MDMNPYEMGSGYQDYVNSWARSRETDSDQRWELGDSFGGGSRVRLLCSYGGKIQHRPHDNQLSYVGGDTRILAVDRNIRFSSMIGKLSSLWKSSISFKYQLPNEDLDALVSVTDDEDMENMMAEYDRLQKMGSKSSRLRLFVFANKPDDSSQKSKPENRFVDALNGGPVSRSETAPQGPWINNMPDFLQGGNGVEDDRNSAQRGCAVHGTNSKEQKAYMGRELRQPEVHSAPNSPMIGHSSIDSNASSPARTNTSGTPPGSDQAEMGRNLGRGFELNSNLPSNSTQADSRPVPEILAGKVVNPTANTNVKEQHPVEFSVVSSSLINEQAPQQPQLQVPIQEFQKLQLRQPQDPIARAVNDNDNLNITGRRISSDPVKAVNLSIPDMTRPNPILNEGHIPQQRQYQQTPSPSEYYMNKQGSHFLPESYWQIHEAHGGQQPKYQPVYFVPEGSPMLQPMTTVRQMGQPAAGGGGGYYNPGQRVTAPVQVYSPDAPPLSNPVTTVRGAAIVQRQVGSDPTEPAQIPPPAPKGLYTPVPSMPVSSDVRAVSKPTAPVPLVHKKPYSYRNVGPYEASSRQVYCAQAPPVLNPQYQLRAVGNVNPVDFRDASSPSEKY